MSKRNKSSASKKKKAGSLAYQIKKLELRRKGKDKPMLAKTEQQYKKHALKLRNTANLHTDVKHWRNASPIFRTMRII